MSTHSNVKYLLVRFALLKIGKSNLSPQSYFLHLSGFGSSSVPFFLYVNNSKFKTQKWFSFHFYRVALSELQKNVLELSFQPISTGNAALLKRMFSLSIQSGRLIGSVKYGYKAKIKFEKDEFLNAPVISDKGGGELWMARTALRSGLFCFNLSPSLEFNFRRNSKNELIAVTDVKLRFSGGCFFRILNFLKIESLFDLLVLKGDLDSAKVLARILPMWHYGRSYFSIQFDSDSFGASNIITTYPTNFDSVDGLKDLESDSDFRVIDFESNFTISGDVFIYNNYIFRPQLEDHSPTVQDFNWPNYVWGSSDGSFRAFPNFLGERKFGKGLVVAGNRGWGHFVEEEIPKFMILEARQESSNVPIFSYSFDEAQNEILSSLLSTSVEFLEPGYKHSFTSGSTVINRNFRKKAASGETNFYSDQLADLLRLFKEKIMIDSPEVSPSDYIYIAREEGLFRNLENKDRMEDLLAKWKFKKIYTTNLSLYERISIISSAKVILTESG